MSKERRTAKRRLKRQKQKELKNKMREIKEQAVTTDRKLEDKNRKWKSIIPYESIGDELYEKIMKKIKEEYSKTNHKMAEEWYGKFFLFVSNNKNVNLDLLFDILDHNLISQSIEIKCRISDNLSSEEFNDYLNNFFQVTQYDEELRKLRKYSQENIPILKELAYSKHYNDNSLEEVEVKVTLDKGISILQKRFSDTAMATFKAKMFLAAIISYSARKSNLSEDEIKYTNEAILRFSTDVIEKQFALLKVTTLSMGRSLVKTGGISDSRINVVSGKHAIKRMTKKALQISKDIEELFQKEQLLDEKSRTSDHDEYLNKLEEEYQKKKGERKSAKLLQNTNNTQNNITEPELELKKEYNPSLSLKPRNIRQVATGSSLKIDNSAEFSIAQKRIFEAKDKIDNIERYLEIYHDFARSNFPDSDLKDNITNVTYNRVLRLFFKGASLYKDKNREVHINSQANTISNLLLHHSCKIPFNKKKEIINIIKNCKMEDLKNNGVVNNLTESIRKIIGWLDEDSISNSLSKKIDTLLMIAPIFSKSLSLDEINVHSGMLGSFVATELGLIRQDMIKLNIEIPKKNTGFIQTC